MQDPATGYGAGGSVFDEIRRQVEEMLSARRPPGPRVIQQAPEARAPGRPEGTDVGMIATTVGAYWLLALAAARRRRRVRRRAAPGR